MGSSLTLTSAQKQSLDAKLVDILEKYEKHLRLQKNRSPATLRSYTTQALLLLEYRQNYSEQPSQNSHFIFEDAEIVRAHLREASNTLHAHSQAQKVSALKCFLKYLINEKLCPQEILRALERPKTPRPLIQVLPEELLLALRKIVFEKRPLTEQMLFELLYGSGLRISEVQSLKWSDFPPPQRQAPKLEILGKGRKRRLVPITQEALDLAQTLKKQSTEGPFAQNNVRTLRLWVEKWALLLPENDLRIYPHLLRHSLASHLLRRGAHLPEIQRLLGHAQLSTTERYTHLNLDELVKIYDKSFKLH